MAKQSNTFDSTTLLQYMFPKDMLKYFEITNAEEEHTGKYDETKTEIVLLHVYMDERDLRDKEWHGLKPNGFTEARTIHDFPLRELKVVLHVRRRRWLAGDGGNVILNRIPLAAVAELKRQEREFKKRLAQNQKRRENYRKKHPKNYKGKVRGPKPMRKNTRFTAPKIELEVKGKKVYETKVELLTHVRYPLMKSRDKWTRICHSSCIVYGCCLGRRCVSSSTDYCN